MAKKLEDEGSAIDGLVTTINKSSKYGNVSEDVVRRVAREELRKGRNMRDTVKAIKSKLHQIGGAYLERMDYEVWLEELEQISKLPDKSNLKKGIRQIIRHHASTSERLSILDEFYAHTLSKIAPVTSVIDAACGLNPLTIPWMPLAENAPYYAYDIYEDMIGFLNNYFHLAGINGQAETCDLTQFVPQQRVHLALVLKTLPCLAQLDKQVGQQLLERIQADYVLVTFPVRSLSGHDKNMRANYDVYFNALMVDKTWTIERFEFATELAFLINKKGHT